MMQKNEAQEVIQLLKKNGGPLAKRAAALILQLLKETTPAKPSAGIHPDHEAIVLLFQRRLNKPQRDAKETRVFRDISHLVTAQDLKNLKRLYKQPQSKGFHQILSRRKNSPTTLMRAYIEQADLAAQWSNVNPPAPDPKSTKYPEIKGWQSKAPGRLSERSWPLVCSQYPEIAKKISETMQATCTNS